MFLKSILSKSLISLDNIYGKLFSTIETQNQSCLSDRLIEFAYRLDDRNAIATYKQGVKLAEKKKWTPALNAFQDTLQCKQLPPPSFYHHYGVTLLQVGAEVMAKQAFEMSLYHLPKAYWSAYELGLIYFRSGKFSEAEKCFRIVVKESKAYDSAFLHLAHSLLAQGYESHGDEAIMMYLEFAERRPNDPTPFQQLKNQTLFSSLTQEKHLSRVKQLVEKHPDAHHPLWLLGWIKSEQRKVGEAIDLFKRVSTIRLLQERPKMQTLLDPQSRPLPPTFIIIGAERSGTSSLFEWLSQHPKIISPIQKRVDFINNFVDCGVDWYQSHFPQVQPAAGFISGESSPAYLQFARRAPILKEHYPKMKLIVLHRDPVKRAFSHYQRQIHMGLSLGSWSNVVRAELDLLAEQLPDKDYDFSKQKSLLAMGCVLPQLEQWLDVFPAEQMLVIKSESMFAKPQYALDKVVQFLELPFFELPEFKNVNPGHSRPMSAKLEKYLTNWFEPHEQALDTFLKQHQLMKVPAQRDAVMQQARPFIY